MRETIYDLLSQQGDITWQQVTGHICVSLILGLFIFLSYAISHKGTIYSKKFAVTLVVLTVMTATVMTVIGNNIALSLGMVGAEGHAGAEVDGRPAGGHQLRRGQRGLHPQRLPADAYQTVYRT